MYLHAEITIVACLTGFSEEECTSGAELDDVDWGSVRSRSVASDLAVLRYCAVPSLHGARALGMGGSLSSSSLMWSRLNVSSAGESEPALGLGGVLTAWGGAGAGPAATDTLDGVIS